MGQDTAEESFFGYILSFGIAALWPLINLVFACGIKVRSDPLLMNLFHVHYAADHSSALVGEMGAFLFRVKTHIHTVACDLPPACVRQARNDHDALKQFREVCHSAHLPSLEQQVSCVRVTVLEPVPVVDWAVSLVNQSVDFVQHGVALKVMFLNSRRQVDLLIALTDTSRHEAKVALLASRRDIAGS